MRSLGKRFDTGVQYYTVTNLDINISFPEDEFFCEWCPFLRHLESLDRDKCAITEETLYSRKLRGRHCPLVVINSVNAEEMKNESNV